ncbi:TAXI family TRAP transporter solute-binding subunit [Pseudonocardiaceae bacterium YIM PH 21723]|nr:TAXI family TRAP transporter solute-binding subunit [Pseudonocardiaceae bacterium YIM PH 21723]
MIDRRLFLAGLAGLLSACTGSGEPPRIRIAAGEDGGFYLAFARLLAQQLPGGTAVSTQGSADNLDRLRTGQAEVALSLADTAQACGFPLRALGRVYENYMQLVVRADSPLWSVGELSGRAVSLGATGSGAALFGERLLRAAGVTPDARHLPIATAIADLGEGRLDALLWSGGVPTPALAELDARIGIRLLPLEVGRAYGAVYEPVQVPEGAYRQVSGIRTVGVANLLVCVPELPDETASAVAGTLVRQAAALVPQQAVGTQFLDARSLITTAGIPLHPGAADAYRRLHG